MNLYEIRYLNISFDKSITEKLGELYYHILGDPINYVNRLDDAKQSLIKFVKETNALIDTIRAKIATPAASPAVQTASKKK